MVIFIPNKNIHNNSVAMRRI